MKKLLLFGCLLLYSAGCLAMNQKGPQDIEPTAPPFDPDLFNQLPNNYSNNQADTNTQLKVYIPSSIQDIKKIKTVVATVPFAISADGERVAIHGKIISHRLFPKNVKFMPYNKEWLAFTDNTENQIGVISLIASKPVQLSTLSPQGVENYYCGEYDSVQSKTKVWADCPVDGFKKLFENGLFKLLKE